MEDAMHPVRCPHFDELVRTLVDAYRQLGDNDVFCMLNGVEIPGKIKQIHVEMAEHRRTCPMCRKLDEVRPSVEKVNPGESRGLLGRKSA
jgi:hypothetical protein